MAYNAEATNIVLKSGYMCAVNHYMEPTDLECIYRDIYDNQEKKTKEDYKKLSEEMLKSIVETNLNGRWDYINALKNRVGKWNDDCAHLSDGNEVNVMKNKWKILLRSKLEEKSGFIKMSFEKKHDVEFIRVYATKPSVKDILEYNEIYFEVMDNYLDIDCDFLVLDFEE